ncbi:sugar-binding protein [Klebsiella oxytoca]|nr:sugar-binding protein [Klebsiella oxytoca]
MKDVIDLSQFDAKELQTTTVDGKLNGIPISVTARVFYFNDETWKKAGVEYPKTWDELMAAGKTFESKLGQNSITRSCWSTRTLWRCSIHI